MIMAIPTESSRPGLATRALGAFYSLGKYTCLSQVAQWGTIKLFPLYKYGICMENFMPDFAKRGLRHGAVYQGRLVNLIMSTVSMAAPSLAEEPSLLRKLCIGPIVEELFNRYLLQTILLKEIPKGVLRRVSPSSEHVLDTTIAKLARIAICATIFAGWHIKSYGCNRGGTIPQFYGGLLLSTLRETGTDMRMLLALHSTNNLIGYLVKGR